MESERGPGSGSAQWPPCPCCWRGGGGDDDAATATSAASATSVASSSTTRVTPSTAEVADALEATALAAGDQHACAVTAAGTVCWGYNHYGQLGDGTTEDHFAPAPIAGGLELRSLAAGRYFTCGLAAEGRVWCWGDNSRGQLGDGTRDSRPEPVAAATDTRFDSIVAGQLHVCGVTTAGDVWCWGAYASGQLGTAAGADQLVPAPSAPEPALDRLALGGHTHSCGLTAEGAAYCWGNNTFGQLGDGQQTNAAQASPRPVAGGHVFTELVLGQQHTCGLASDGAAWCWGSNRDGQLGTGGGGSSGQVPESLEPIAVVGGHAFVALTGGGLHTCGVDREGAAWCWGANPDGRVGDGQRGETVLEPTAVAGALRFDVLRGGEEYTCGITDAGAVHCWGSNRVGWVGDGTTEPRLEPVPVRPVA